MRVRHLLAHPAVGALIGALAAWLLRALGATWRVRVLGPELHADGEVRLGALWHRDAALGAWFYRDRGIMMPVSQSRDGDIFDAMLLRLGFASSARGSSSRGGLGLLRQMIRGLRSDLTVAVLPDGPRGPARKAKPGVIALAAATGKPIYPVALAGQPTWTTGSWDRIRLPRPFARVVCAYGEPLAVPRQLDEATRESCLKELERRLDALRARVDREVGAPPDPPPGA
jgi:lysophospholipid acyltransferase (LPLAT)-like uncharacterized protein